MGASFMPKILIIDDDEMIRQYLSALLERAGFEARAVDGREALQVATDDDGFDAIITDLYMPEVDGIEIVIAVRRTMPDLPIIGITGGRSSADDPCVVAMTRLGAAAVLRKPIDRLELLGVLSRVLKTKGGTGVSM